MYNAEDDMELDRLSKEAAERYEAPGNADWSKMMAELDKVLPIEKQRKNYFLFWWLLPLLFVGGGALYYFQNQPAKQIPTSVHSTSITPSIATKEEKQETVKNILKEPIKGTNVSPAVAPAKKPAQQETLTKNIVVFKNISKKTLSSNQENDKNILLKENNESILSSSIIPAEKAKALEQPAIEKAVTTNTKDNQQLAIEKTVTTESKKNTDTEISEKVDEYAKTDMPFAGAKNSTQFNIAGKGWSYAVLVGVDKSTVKFTYGNEPGYNIGINGGYHFNKNWSLHTGAIYTQKNYKLAGEDFTPQKGSWVSYVKVENVEGYCRMWEIPLILSYSLNSKHKNNFFLSTGLSSYFMTSENYNYFYYSNGIPVTRGATYESTDTHILSILHFSGGFENRISNKLSLLIEPYAKIPLEGVGLGNIQLSSFGINFSAQFRKTGKK